ncbi:F-box only protein 40-like isoform X2 [Syngnathoides biaculeatus]|uniref:F-box only protein 40-like isoform X2 n=1 Tax=Syngnathoides biaculeatus TaxID=300417 RepID=UPI002ADDB13E|nr:F-box only protein 40-like isoform X2 [Syngnathoides biaculeatus]
MWLPCSSLVDSIWRRHRRKIQRLTALSMYRDRQRLCAEFSVMSARRASSGVVQHAHCASCYSGRCRAQVEAGVCCALVACRLRCGAVFHMCKEEGHLPLCPRAQVPCLNAAYGCPARLPRDRLAAHLLACPASVVVCGAEWNRWPVDRTDPHCVQGEERGRPEALDAALAMADQDKLFARLKMGELYPEMTEWQNEQEEEKQAQEEELRSRPDQDTGLGANAEQRSVPKGNQSKVTEMTSGMKGGGCAPAEVERNREEADGESTGKAPGGPGSAGMKEGGRAPAEAEGNHAEARGESAGRAESSPGSARNAGDATPDMGKMGLAPWQDGVLERLGQELSPQEYNMYVVHHGRMLLAFGHIRACTPRDEDFVYGSLEPIPVQTLRSFKVPTSYRYCSRVQLYDAGVRAPSEHRGGDTSDLPVGPDDLYDDEIDDTLVELAEREARGHKISEWKAGDGLYVDVGTQTHRFRSAQFKRDSTLAQVTAGRTRRLHLALRDESTSGRHNRARCVFNFLCGRSFLRREYAPHVRNVHCDIRSGLSGWFEQRCPLAYLGCTYTCTRFRPAGCAAVTYNPLAASFNLRPSADAPPASADSFDALSSLPFEVLRHVATFLDALSLSQLALASPLLRRVCATLLPMRGMVSLRWRKAARPGGGVRWVSEPVWEFSCAFSPVLSWRMSDAPPMWAHLKVCPFYETSLPDRPVALLSAAPRDGCQRRHSLVKHFTASRR